MPEDRKPAPDVPSAATRRPLPAWAWLFIVPCTIATLVAIDRGARIPPSATPAVDLLRAMAAVLTASTCAFASAALARSLRPLSIRLSGSVALLALTALALHVGQVGEAVISWRTLRLPALSLDLPGPVDHEERREPGPRGEALVFEWSARAHGATFVLQEREEPDASDAAALVLRVTRRFSESGAQILRETPLDLGSPAARELLLRDRGILYRVRLIARPPLLFVLRAGPVGGNEAELERFFGSLRFE